MTSADQVFFRSYALQLPSTYTYSTNVGTFYTYPANDPGGFSIDSVTSTSMRVNWTLTTEGGEERAIVLVSTDNTWGSHPADGTVYAASNDEDTNFGDAVSGNDYVAFAGSGTTVTLVNLPAETPYWIRVYTYSGTGSGTSGVRYKTDGTPAAGVPSVL